MSSTSTSKPNYPELLLPSGTIWNMRHAFSYGVDAVYTGQPRYSLWVRNNDFALDNLEIGIHGAHFQNKKFFVASNLMLITVKYKSYMVDIVPVTVMKTDALIIREGFVKKLCWCWWVSWSYFTLWESNY